MGKTGAARRAGFAVGDDFLALLLHAITSFLLGWWNKAHPIWLRRMLLCFDFQLATSKYSLSLYFKDRGVAPPPGALLF